ncbi:hypothetical protein LG315_01670 [Microbacterium marinum]|uniref:hypothetical protein n=1 Tax=Microbacterium marinum TaxID=421115 RepID=UPI00384FAFA8
MADAQHLISVPDSVHPWSLLFEIAQVTTPGEWVLVGGLMVHVHAVRAGIRASRPTEDVDLLLNIAASTVAAVAGPLQTIGFRPADPLGRAVLHRFHRGQESIDIMVERGASARWGRRSIFQAPAARQAIDRSDWYDLRGADRTVRIAVPDALGAIVAKAAAYTVDQRDRKRHLDDLAVLLSAAGGRRGLDLERLTTRDNQHLRPAFALLADHGHDSWMLLDPPDRTIGQRAADMIIAAVATG